MSQLKLVKSFRPLSGSYVSQFTAWIVTAAALFPSPVGELCFSILALGTVDTVPDNTKVSVPCRGAMFLNLKITVFINTVSIRFRPLLPRNCSLLFPHCFHQYGFHPFPSPVGELCFSIIYGRLTKNIYILFPSPVGELCFSIEYGKNGRKLKFPSPVGELCFSITSPFKTWLRVLNLFPSPVGELCFSILPVSKLCNKRKGMFPSPVGELCFSMAAGKFLK